MTVLFDPVTGRLRLSADHWEALLSWSQGRSSPDRQTADLRTAGVIDQGHLHTSLVPALGAALEPVITLAVEQSDDEGVRIDGTGWVGPAGGAFLLDAPDELRELVVVHPAMLPATLARIVALGPRERGATSPRRHSDAAMGALLSADTRARRAAVNEAGGDSLSDLIDGPWNHWSIRAQWPPDGQHGLAVLDTVQQMWLIERSAGMSLLRPTDPTEVWRLLIRILPTDDELAVN